MRNFGWAYLLLSLLGVVSTMMAFMPLINHNPILMPIGYSFVAGFTMISPLVSISSIIVIILACLDRLRPRLAFFTLSLCYLWLWTLGIRLHAYYLNLYHSPLSPGFWSIATFWLPNVRVSHKDIPVRFAWLYLIVWLALSIHGIYAFRKTSIDAGDNASGEKAKIRWPEFKILMVLPSLIVGFLGSFLINILFSNFFIHGLAIFLVFPIAVGFYLLAIFLLGILGRKTGMVVVGLICGCLILAVPIAEHYTFAPIREKVEYGFDSNPEAAKEAEVLVEASRRGDCEKVEALIAKGADVNAPGRIGIIPLVAASKEGRREVVEVLIAKGVEINAETHMTRQTALMAASRYGHHEVVKTLLAKGAEVNAKSSRDGETALMEASRHGHREVVKTLLARGAEVNAQSHDGGTALRYASFKDDLEIVQALLAKGADVNAQSIKGQTALMSAAKTGSREIVQALLAKGADVNAKHNNGGVALFSPSSKGNLEMVKMLLAHGADVNAKDKRGETALSIATQKNHREVRELLIKAGAE